MRILMAFGATLALGAMAFAEKEETPLKSGIQVGERTQVFQVVKLSGAEKDGVSVGDQLCYV